MAPPSSPSATPDTTVDRTAEIDADVDEVWEALTDPDALGEWLGSEVELELSPGEVGRVVDPDGTVRQVLVTDVEDHRRVAWHWWEDDGPLTSVEITLSPIPTGTRVDVVEIFAREHRVPARPDLRGSASATASRSSLTTSARTGRDEAAFRMAPGRWASRLSALSASPFAVAAHR
jgi:uncharacterized protein YndB with AHSA1/START domain